MTSNPNVIGILDYGAGNIASLKRMFDHLSISSTLVSTSAEVSRVRKLVIPGVGHFGYAMQELNKRDLIGALNEAAFGTRIPILGICLGMQLLSRYSEEGDAEGLGWIDAKTVRFKFPEENSLPIPNMGWRKLSSVIQTPLFLDPLVWRFYFVHSYHVVCADRSNILASAHYGQEYVASAGARNILGVQFHPEKSHKFGMALLSAFAKWRENP